MDSQLSCTWNGIPKYLFDSNRNTHVWQIQTVKTGIDENLLVFNNLGPKIFSTPLKIDLFLVTNFWMLWGKCVCIKNLCVLPLSLGSDSKLLFEELAQLVLGVVLIWTDSHNVLTYIRRTHVKYDKTIIVWRGQKQGLFFGKCVSLHTKIQFVWLIPEFFFFPKVLLLLER